MQNTTPASPAHRARLGRQIAANLRLRTQTDDTRDYAILTEEIRAIRAEIAVLETN